MFGKEKGIKEKLGLWDLFDMVGACAGCPSKKGREQGCCLRSWEKTRWLNAQGETWVRLNGAMGLRVEDVRVIKGLSGAFVCKASL